METFIYLPEPKSLVFEQGDHIGLVTSERVIMADLIGGFDPRLSVPDSLMQGRLMGLGLYSLVQAPESFARILFFSGPISPLRRQRLEGFAARSVVNEEITSRLQYPSAHSKFR